MVIKSILDTRKSNRYGKYPVKIRISIGGEKKYISIGIYADISEFNVESGLLNINDKKTQREKVQQNNIINSVLEDLNNLIYQYKKENKPFSLNILIMDYLKIYNPEKEEEKDVVVVEKKKKEPQTFNSYFQHFIDQKTSRTKEIYQVTLNKIEEYFPKKLSFEEIDIFSMMDMTTGILIR